MAVSDSAEGLRAEIAAAVAAVPPEATGEAWTTWVGSWNGRQGRGAHRLACTASSGAELRRKLALALDTLERGGDRAFLPRQGIFLGTGRVEGKLALLFPGQGPQYRNMLQELGSFYPLVREVFAQGDAAFQAIAGRSLTATFTGPVAEGTVAQDESTIHSAVMLVNYALYRQMHACGLEPELLLGQSAGEFSALLAAGAWPLETALKAMYQRTRRVLEVPSETGGRMASVGCGWARLRPMLAGLPGWVGLASDNSPSVVTISGEQGALQQLALRCEREGINFELLPISHGYHSHLIGRAVPGFQSDLGGVDVAAPRVPVLSSVDGCLYQPQLTPAFMAHHLARQLVIPVEFVHHVRKLYDEGARLFVESGPRWSLTTFASEILGPERPHVSCAAVHPKVGELEQFHRLLAAGFTWGRVSPERQPAFCLERPAVPEARTRSSEAGASEAEVQGFVVRLLAEATGHRPEALGPDLDLDAQLGIGTAKQLDVLAQAFGRFVAATDRNTIRKLVALVRERAGGSGSETVQTPAVAAAPVAVSAPVEEPAAKTMAAPDEAEVQGFVVGLLADKTGYPPELLEPDLDLEAQLGIDTVKQVDVLAQAFARYMVAPDRKLRVRNYNTIRKMVALVRER
ncbi:MAG TPA: acyltransferase domain-containing protein, partial [Myxococcus sp.]|nr:acyltransferase domain-containing protein [Myxococcus sp.]